jgi:hypothetical protein
MSVGSKHREKEAIFPYRTGIKDACFLLGDIHQSYCGTEQGLRIRKLYKYILPLLWLWVLLILTEPTPISFPGVCQQHAPTPINPSA